MESNEGNSQQAGRGNSDREKAALYCKVLKVQLADVHTYLRAGDIDREDLSRDDLRAISARLDRALDALTGTNRRDRALFWLDREMQRAARTLRGRQARPRELKLSAADMGVLMDEVGVEISLGGATTKGLVGSVVHVEETGAEVDLLDPSFVAEAMVRIPWYAGRVDQRLSDLLYEYCASLVTPARRGRKRLGAERVVGRWERFHDLAVGVDLWRPRQGIEELKRTMRRTKERLGLSAASIASE